MNFTLFKANWKTTWTLLLTLMILVIMYTVIIITMYDPETMTAYFNMMMETLPQPILKAMGFEKVGHDLTQYIASYLYGFIYIIFPMIYTVIAANNLMAKHIDSGSMAFLLTTPNSRVKIATTQGLYLIASIGILFLASVAVGIILCVGLFPGSLDIGKYLILNMVTFFVTISIGAISFLFSCIASETRESLAFGAGIPALFFVLKMLSGANENLSWMKYLTLYSIIDYDKILNDMAYVIGASFFLMILTGLFFCAGVFWFNRRSLSI